MNTEWNLDILYKGLDDPAYEEDINKFQQVSTEMVELVKSAGELPMKERAEKILYKMEEVERYIVKLINYLSLSSSVDTENGNFSAQQNRVMKIYSDMADSLFAAERMLSEIPDVDELAKESDIVKEYTFYIKELKKEMSHRLSDEVEAMITAMDITGGSAWENLQNYLTSTVKVDYDGGEVTLSEIRNLAYSDDAAVRKAAYEAEIKESGAKIHYIPAKSKGLFKQWLCFINILVINILSVSAQAQAVKKSQSKNTAVFLTRLTTAPKHQRGILID